MKKLLSVLLALVMLVSVISVPAFAEGETTSVVYNYEGGTTSVTEGVTAGEAFAIKFVAPSTSDKYFVGWYTDAQFTGEPVASITAVDGVNNLYARYKEYPANVNVNFLASHGNNHYPSAYLPTLKTDRSLYAARAKMVTYSILGVTTNEDADGTYYEMQTNGPSSLWFADEDDMMYQLRPNANYKLTFQYKHNGKSDGVLTVSAALGKAKAAFATIDEYDAAARWGEDRSAVKQFGGFTANNTTEWRTADITFNTSELNYADNYPLVGLYIDSAGWGDGEGLQFKNIVLEELIPEELSVVYHYLDENGEWAEEPVTEGVTLNGSYRVDFIPENTASKYFTGWYDNEQYNGNPVASITTSIDGKNHLYARYKEYPTNANVGFLASHGGGGNHIPAIYWPTKSSADGIYYASAKMVNYTIDGVQSATDEFGAYNFVESNGPTMLVLADADNMAYQVKPNTSYKVTFEYKHGGNGGDNSMTVNAFIGQTKTAGTKDSWSDAIIWGDVFAYAETSTAITVNDTNKWNTHSFVNPGSDLAGYYPVIGLRFESFTNPERIFFKNIVIEEYEIPDVAVNLYVDGEIDKTEEVAPGSTFLPDYIPEKEGCYFTGWFTNPECTNAVPAEGVVVNEETNLYAGFETYKTVKYYVNGNVVKEVGELKVGDTYVVDYEPTAIEGMIFKGWYTEEAFTNVATSIAITGDVNLYAKFAEQFGLTYVYKNKDGSEAKKAVEGVQVGDAYAIDFLAPNTNTQYFVGWYLDSNYATEATAKVTLANDEAYKLYAKYVDYPTSIDLIIPGNGATNETVKMPIITTEGSVDKVVEYATNPIVASVFRGASTYDAATNTTTFNGSDSYPNYYISHILTDANKNFVAGKPGKTYKITFEATSSTGDVRVSFGVGAPADNFERAWGAYQWNRNKSYRDLLKRSSSVTLAKDVFDTYSIVYTVPADFPEDAYNFLGLYFDKTGATGDTYAVRNISIEEYVAKAYLHVGDEVEEVEVASGSTFLPDYIPEKEGYYFTGWYTNADLTEAMPEEGVVVEGDVHLYAGFETYKTVKYYVNGEVVKEVGELKVGDTYVVDYEPTAIEGMIFKGWYTEEAFTNVATSIAITGDVNLYAKFAEQFGLTYVYKNKDGSEAKKVVEGVQVGGTYAIDFLAPNTNTQYFVGWYLTPDYSVEATANVNLANDEAYKLYAKYVDYPTSADLIIPGNGNVTEVVRMPVITDPAGVDKVKAYATYPWVASVFRGASTYDAATNTTTFNGDSGYPNYYISHILTDANKNFVAGKPGKTYKITFEATSSTGAVTASFGVGAPSNAFELAWGNVQWNRRENYGSGYRNLLNKSSSVTLAKDVFDTYSIVYTVPADFPEDAYNFLGLYFDKTGVTGDTYAVRNISIEEYVAKAYLHVGDEVTEAEVTPGVPFIPEINPTLPGMVFKGWFLDENFATAMPETGAPVEGDVHLYAKFVEPFGLTYVYKNKDGSEAKKAVEGVQVGDAYAIDFLAPNTNTQYFVGWYLTPDYSVEATANVNLANDEAYKLYAKYVDYPTNMDLIVPGNGATNETVKMPIITTEGSVDKVVEYATNPIVASVFRGASTYDATTNTTTFNGDSGYPNYYISHILTDANKNFVAGKPGKTYKISFEATSSTGAVTVRVGVGAPADNFERAWGAYQWNRNKSYRDLLEKSSPVTLAKDVFDTYSIVYTVPADFPEDAYNFFGLYFDKPGVTGDTYAVRNISIEEYEIPDSAGEYSEQIGGVVYEAAEVEDGATYAVTFNYTGAAANFGFFTADKEEAGVYTNVGAVDGDKVIISVNGDGTYTAFVTVDKASGDGDTLYAYAKDATTAGEVTDVTVTKLADVIANDGAAVLNGDREQAAGAQAIRYFFAYNTTDGKDIIINGVSYAIKERGFLFANGKDKLDDGVWTGAQGLVKRAVSGDALANCWSATANGDGSFRIQYSTYVGGFAADDTRELFVKGYITFTANGTDYTIYADASNGSVATIKTELGL